jgi:hypothetical protein
MAKSRVFGTLLLSVITTCNLCFMPLFQAKAVIVATSPSVLKAVKWTPSLPSSHEEVSVYGVYVERFDCLTRDLACNFPVPLLGTKSG